MKKMLMVIGMIMLAALAFGEENPLVGLYERFEVLKANFDPVEAEQLILEAKGTLIEFETMRFVIVKTPAAERLQKIEDYREIRDFTVYEDAIMKMSAAFGSNLFSFQEQNQLMMTIAANGPSPGWVMPPYLKPHLMTTDQLKEHYTNVLKNTPLNEGSKGMLEKAKSELLKLKDL